MVIHKKPGWPSRSSRTPWGLRRKCDQLRFGAPGLWLGEPGKGSARRNALQFIGAGIRHDDAGATAPSRTSTRADAGFVIKIGRGIDDDAREVLG
jgi:hypothetical protein